MARTDKNTSLFAGLEHLADLAEDTAEEQNSTPTITEPPTSKVSHELKGQVISLQIHGQPFVVEDDGEVFTDAMMTDPYIFAPVLEAMIQAIVRRIASMSYFADTVQLGDEPLADLAGKRPLPDQANYERVLTEAQSELVLKNRGIIYQMEGMLVDLATWFKDITGKKPAYALINQHGTWVQLTDYTKAADEMYRREYQRRKDANSKDERLSLLTQQFEQSKINDALLKSASRLASL